MSARPSPSRTKTAARDTAAALLAWLNARNLPSRPNGVRSLADVAHGAVLSDVLGSMSVLSTAEARPRER